MKEEEALAFLQERIRFGMRPGTERIEALCSELGRPQDAYPVLHVAGTNAKFSTLEIASRILTALGLWVGTYTSPDLGNVRERIAIGHTPLDSETFASLLGYLRPYVELVEDRMGDSLTYFELLTALAYEAFFDRAVHAAVIEAGLGGEYDATNVADAKVGILTNVSLDHIRQFGGDLTRAAWEKAGIAKPGTVVVTGVEQDDLFEIVCRRAFEKGGASVLRLGRDVELVSRAPAVGGQLLSVRGLYGTYEDLFLPLFGPHQARNAALAIVGCEAFLGRELDRDVLDQGLRTVTTPGRMEVLGRRPLVMCDGGHNPGAAAAVRQALEEAFFWQRLVMVVGMVDSKPIEAVARIWAPLVDHAVVTVPKTERAGDPGRIARALEVAGLRREEIEVVWEVPAAVERALELAAPEDLVLIFGSFYTATEARNFLRSRAKLSQP